MSRLIKAEYARLFHSLIFWLAVITTTFFGILIPSSITYDIKQNWELYQRMDINYRNIDGNLFTAPIMLMIMLAVFMAIFISTEYSDGTIRNKIINGHKRAHIYFSKLLICSTVTIALNIYFILLMLALGNLLLESSAIPLRDFILFSECSSFFLVAAIALYLLLGMLIQNKAANAVCVLLLAFGMLFAGLMVDNALREPEYFEGYSYFDEDTGEVETVPSTKNPHYIRGMKRKICEKLYVIIPGCQIYQVTLQEKKQLAESSVYALVVIILSSGGGMVLFERKDLK